MQLPLNAPVRCTDGEGGTSTRVIIDPTTRRATHLVVRQPGRPGAERLVPVDVVRATPGEEILLSCSCAQVAAMETFSPEDFLEAPPHLGALMTDEPGMIEVEPASRLLWPYVYPHLRHHRADLPRSRKDDVPVRRGATVEARDGRVGRVLAFVVDPNDDHLTDVVVEAGHVLNRQEAVVPLSLVDSWDEDVLRLSVDRGTVAALPHLPLRHVGERMEDPMGGADRGLEPELPGAAGVPVEDTDDAHVEGARILVDQARPRLRERGFSDEEIREWAEAFLREEGSGGAEDLLAWIARREGGRR